MAKGVPPQWIRMFPLLEAPRTGDGLFEGEVIEVAQVGHTFKNKKTCGGVEACGKNIRIFTGGNVYYCFGLMCMMCVSCFGTDRRSGSQAYAEFVSKGVEYVYRSVGVVV